MFASAVDWAMCRPSDKTGERTSCSELGAAVDTDRVAADPVRRIRSQKGYHWGDVFGLGDALQRLHRHCRVAALVGLREAGHIRGDDARRDRVDADAPWPEVGG